MNVKRRWRARLFAGLAAVLVALAIVPRQADAQIVDGIFVHCLKQDDDWRCNLVRNSAEKNLSVGVNLVEMVFDFDPGPDFRGILDRYKLSALKPTVSIKLDTEHAIYDEVTNLTLASFVKQEVLPRNIINHEVLIPIDLDVAIDLAPESLGLTKDSYQRLARAARKVPSSSFSGSSYLDGRVVGDRRPKYYLRFVVEHRKKTLVATYRPITVERSKGLAIKPDAPKPTEPKPVETAQKPAKPALNVKDDGRQTSGAGDDIGQGPRVCPEIPPAGSDPLSHLTPDQFIDLSDLSPEFSLDEQVGLFRQRVLDALPDGDPFGARQPDPACLAAAYAQHNAELLEARFATRSDLLVPLQTARHEVDGQLAHVVNQFNTVDFLMVANASTRRAIRWRDDGVAEMEQAIRDQELAAAKPEGPPTTARALVLDIPYGASADITGIAEIMSEIAPRIASQLSLAAGQDDTIVWEPGSLGIATYFSKDLNQRTLVTGIIHYQAPAGSVSRSSADTTPPAAGESAAWILSGADPAGWSDSVKGALVANISGQDRGVIVRRLARLAGFAETLNQQAAARQKKSAEVARDYATTTSGLIAQYQEKLQADRKELTGKGEIITRLIAVLKADLQALDRAIAGPDNSLLALEQTLAQSDRGGNGLYLVADIGSTPDNVSDREFAINQSTEVFRRLVWQARIASTLMQSAASQVGSAVVGALSDRAHEAGFGHANIHFDRAPEGAGGPVTTFVAVGLTTRGADPAVLFANAHAACTDLTALVAELDQRLAATNADHLKDEAPLAALDFAPECATRITEAAESFAPAIAPRPVLVKTDPVRPDPELRPDPNVLKPAPQTEQTQPDPNEGTSELVQDHVDPGKGEVIFGKQFWPTWADAHRGLYEDIAEGRAVPDDLIARLPAGWRLPSRGEVAAVGRQLQKELGQGLFGQIATSDGGELGVPGCILIGKRGRVDARCRFNQRDTVIVLPVRARP